LYHHKPGPWGQAGRQPQKEAVNTDRNARFDGEVERNMTGTATFMRRHGFAKPKPLHCFCDYESWPHRLAHGGPQVTPHGAERKGVSSTAYAGRLAVFVIRVSYPGGHSVWLTRRFPTVAWGLKKDALPFPTEADAARTIARLRPAGPVSIEPIP
jgi:hypothetical protein